MTRHSLTPLVLLAISVGAATAHADDSWWPARQFMLPGPRATDAYNGVCGCDFSELAAETFPGWVDSEITIYAGECAFTFTAMDGPVTVASCAACEFVFAPFIVESVGSGGWFFVHPNAASHGGTTSPILYRDVNRALDRIWEMDVDAAAWSDAVDLVARVLRHDLRIAGIEPELACPQRPSGRLDYSRAVR